MRGSHQGHRKIRSQSLDSLASHTSGADFGRFGTTYFGLGFHRLPSWFLQRRLSFTAFVLNFVHLESSGWMFRIVAGKLLISPGMG
jgi:hypothetical protein